MKRKCAAWIPRSAPSYFHSFIGFLAVFLQSDNTLLRTRHGPGWDTTTPRPRSVCNRFKGSGLADGLFLSNSLSLDLVVGIFLAHQCQRSHFPQKSPIVYQTLVPPSSAIRLEFVWSHGVFIWLTASGRFQHCTSLKLLPHCQPDGPRAETLPTIPSVHRSKAPPPMSRRPVGTLREHDGRGFGVVPKPLAANRPSSLRHCSPPFIMMRTSFAGCRLRSLFTCSVVLPGRRAQIHIPNDLATIIAAMTFSSQRRVNASSW